MAITLLIHARRMMAHTPVLAHAGASTGYRADNRHRTAAAVAAVMIAGGVGTGLIAALVMPAMLVPVDPPISATNIPMPVVPVLPEPDVRVTIEARDARVTPAPPDRTLPPVGDAPPFTPVPFDGGSISGSGVTGGGAGSGDEIVVPHVPNPVMREARRDDRYAAGFQPPYPAAAQREGIVGTCTVSVTIAPSGRVSAVRNVACANADFYRVTERQALSRWRFEPATRDGDAIESRLTQTVRFEMP